VTRTRRSTARRRCAALAIAALLAVLCRAADIGAAALDDPRTPHDAPHGVAGMLARAEARLTPYFAAQAIPYPPPAAAFVALKEEGRLELWAQTDAGWRFVRSYLIRATSGRLGPKLREGDRQVPEGVYRISALNPNSRYHLSMRLDYPNAFDRARAADEGRSRLGGDIMIHGDRVSIGCIAVGDVAVEELYALASRLGPEGVRVVVSPLDLRRVAPEAAIERAGAASPWLGELYGSIARALAEFPLPADAAPAAGPPRAARATARCRTGDVKDCARRCGRGDVASCTRAGFLYADPSRPGADGELAWAFFRQACAAGDPAGCAELARRLVADDGPRRDVARGAALAGASCDAGDVHGCAVLGRVCAERLVYAGERSACTEERVARAALVQQAACGGWCESGIFEAAAPAAAAP